jgi:hypothetical protein
MWHHVDVLTDVSEGRITSIFRVEGKIRKSPEGETERTVGAPWETHLDFTCACKSSSTLLQLLARLWHMRIHIFTHSVYRLYLYFNLLAMVFKLKI